MSSLHKIFEKKEKKKTRYILVGRCDHEITVKYLFHWAEDIINKANELDLNILDLKNENYVEDKFNSMVTTYNPFFIFCNGHGDKLGYSALGHENNAVISANKNDYLLCGKTVYILSCNTARCLGPIAFDKGCSYIGYEDEFLFWHQGLKEPSADVLAKSFMESSNEVALTILNGGTPREAYENSQKVFDKWITYWEKRLNGTIETTVPPQIVEEIFIALRMDKESQTCLSVE